MYKDYSFVKNGLIATFESEGPILFALYAATVRDSSGEIVYRIHLSHKDVNPHEKKSNSFTAAYLGNMTDDELNVELGAVIDFATNVVQFTTALDDKFGVDRTIGRNK